MRVEELTLERFGVLQGKTFDFSGVAFHVIAGPNGVGKSTVRAAFSDLLYGFAHSSPWAIGFEQSQLKLGATISNRSSKTLTFERLKGRRVSLALPDGTALDEVVLQPFISGIDRRSFEALYALDADRLREGGKEMLKAQSDVGQSLLPQRVVSPPYLMCATASSRSSMRSDRCGGLPKSRFGERNRPIRRPAAKPKNRVAH